MNNNYEKFMRIALNEAECAYKENEIPIGAVVVVNNEIISKNHNRNRQLIDPTAHAEMLVLRDASKKFGVFRLTDAELFVTVEPCPMCAGAVIYSRIKRVIYGCADEKAGCDISVVNILNNSQFNHRSEVVRGILETECKLILQNFFKEKRKLKNESRR